MPSYQALCTALVPQLLLLFFFLCMSCFCVTLSSVPVLFVCESKKKKRLGDGGFEAIQDVGVDLAHIQRSILEKHFGYQRVNAACERSVVQPPLKGDSSPQN